MLLLVESGWLGKMAGAELHVGMGWEWNGNPASGNSVRMACWGGLASHADLADWMNSSTASRKPTGWEITECLRQSHVGHEQREWGILSIRRCCRAEGAGLEGTAQFQIPRCF